MSKCVYYFGRHVFTRHRWVPLNNYAGFKRCALCNRVRAPHRATLAALWTGFKRGLRDVFL